MSFQITLTAGPLILAACIFLLFVAVTYLCWHQGMFDGADSYGISGLFIIAFYAILWAIPSLASVAIWAIWFRGPAA